MIVNWLVKVACHNFNNKRRYDDDDDDDNDDDDDEMGMRSAMTQHTRKIDIF